MSIRFDDRVAIVTGAGGGLGREHALALAARGGASSAAARVVDEIRAGGGKAIASAASVTDFAAVQAMVEEALREWGRVDILVNNDGAGGPDADARDRRREARHPRGIHLGAGAGAAEQVAASWAAIGDRDGEIVPESGAAQGMLEIEKATGRR